MRLSPSARAIPDLAQAFEWRNTSGGITTGEELAALAELHDDATARAVYRVHAPGISISGQAGRLQLVARLASWEQGGEVEGVPPLTAVRLVSLAGLDAPQAALLLSLAVDTILAVEAQQWPDVPERSPRTLTLLERVVPILEDARAQSDCVAPCEAWPWQTRWSLFSSYARAAWREGERSQDGALFERAERRAEQALAQIPDGHPLTKAVSERLLGAVEHSLYKLNRDEAVSTKSLSHGRRALAAFGAPEHRYDRAICERNLERGLRAKMEHSASPGAVDEALAASERALALLDDATPHLRVRALIGRSQLFERRWARSDDLGELAQAQRLLEVAEGVPKVTAPSLLAKLDLEHCDTGSQLAFFQRDVTALGRALAHCEQALGRSGELSLARRAEHYRVHGLALGRLGVLEHDGAALERSVVQFEKSLEAADRAEGERAGPAIRASYAWALRRLASHTSDTAQLQKAVVMIGEALALTDKASRPFFWGELKRLEGATLYSLGWNQRAHFQVDTAIRLYREAKAAFDEALSVFSKAESPKRWASLKEKVGAVLAREGEIGRPKVPLFNRSVAAYQQALQVNRRADDPLAFARTQVGLGSTYLIWADQTWYKGQVRKPATQAVRAFEVAIEIYEKQGEVEAAADAKAHLADALSELQRATGAKDCRVLTLRFEAWRQDPRARGLWHPVEKALNRYDPAKLDKSQCPEVHESFWQRPSPAKRK